MEKGGGVKKDQKYDNIVCKRPQKASLAKIVHYDPFSQIFVLSQK